MKVAISKEVKDGSYLVRISVQELSEEEREKILKFGAPDIDVQANNLRGDWISNLPLHKIDEIFSFDSEEEADIFATEIKNKMTHALNDLRSLKDNFSSADVHEL